MSTQQASGKADKAEDCISNADNVKTGSRLLGGVPGPLFSPNLLASTSDPLIIALLLWLKSRSLPVLIPLER